MKTEKTRIANIVLPLVVLIGILFYVVVLRQSYESYQSLKDYDSSFTATNYFFLHPHAMDGVIFLAAGIVIMIGCLIKNKTVQTSGFALGGILAFFFMLKCLSYPNPNRGCVMLLLLNVIYWLLMLFVSAQLTRITGILAIVTAVLKALWSGGFRIRIGTNGFISSMVSSLPLIILAIAMTLLFVKSPAKNQVSQKGQVSSESTVDKMVKLKALLDSGAITQEEFEAKKKEILK